MNDIEILTQRKNIKLDLTFPTCFPVYILYFIFFNICTLPKDKFVSTHEAGRIRYNT